VKATNVSSLNFGGNATVGNDGSGQVTVGVPFGSEYQVVESDHESYTSGAAYVPKLRLTTAPLSGGAYYVGWYYEVRPADNGSSVVSRVRVDNTWIPSEVEHVALGGLEAITPWHSVSGFKVYTFGAGTKSVLDVDVKAISGTIVKPGANPNVTIRRARLIIWKLR
jgi:hypothetical protein